MPSEREGHRPVGGFPAPRRGDVYAEWYGGSHKAPDLQKEAVYGLTELAREPNRRGAPRRVPGVLSHLVPVAARAAARGRAPSRPAISSSTPSRASAAPAAPPRKAACSRKCPRASTPTAWPSTATRPKSSRRCRWRPARPVTANFTPHLMPMNRGILSSIYVRLADGVTADDARAALVRRYDARAVRPRAGEGRWRPPPAMSGAPTIA